MAPSDSTVVTGPTTAARLPRTGDVLGERYEIRASISSDALYATYRGVDQEKEDSVLVRVVAPGRLSERDAQRMAARLRLLIGSGGPTISPIREVEHDQSRLFVVERFPEGASFRSVLDTRRGKGQLFSPAELVPLVAHLHGALSAVPAPWFHGDLRAERVYVGPERVLLTGGFAPAVMSGELIRETLESDGTLRRELAPETADGLPGASGDRWGVAAMVWEALVGGTSTEAPEASERLGELEPVLRRYLVADPSIRPASLAPLLEALVQRARAPMPRIPVESFGAIEPPTDIDTTELLANPMADLQSSGSTRLGAPGSGSNGVAGSGVGSAELGAPGPSDTAKHTALDGDGLTTVRAPRSDRPRPATPSTERTVQRDLSDIDPALLAAARVSKSVSDSGTFQLEQEELGPLDTSPKAASPNDVALLAQAARSTTPREDAASDTLPTRSAKPSGAKHSSLPAPKRPFAARPASMPAPATSALNPSPPSPASRVPGPAPLPKPANATQELQASELEVVEPSRREPVRAAVSRDASVRPVQVGGPPRPTTFDSAETFVGRKADSVPPPRMTPAPSAPSPYGPSAIAAAPIAPLPVAPVASQLGPEALAPAAPPGPAPLGQAALGPSQFGPVQLGPARLGPAQLGPAQLGPAQLGPAQLGPAQLGPAQLGPAQLGPAGGPRAAPSADELDATPAVAHPLAARERVVAAKLEPAKEPAPLVSGGMIITIAVVLALLILGGAFWYRSAQEEAAREHRIEERLRELRSP